ncbi:MAG: AmmeMemoRadiSam system protein B [Deltaproteobacteria bacterium]|nr:MAG: AmmeMemoRadiSam system protein B [Deltaproteobacteria bacterium]
MTDYSLLTAAAYTFELIRYATSGDVTGDYVRVVGYASSIIG